MKLAMLVGDGRHYRLAAIKGRLFVQTTELSARLPGSVAQEVVKEVAKVADAEITNIEQHPLRGFPEYIHDPVKTGFTKRLTSV